MTAVICPACHGNGERTWPRYTTSSPEDMTVRCDQCKGIPDADGVCRVPEWQWQKWIAHPTLPDAPTLQTIR